MNLAGLVRGAPGEVIGIVGYDIFRRAVVEVPQMLDSGPGSASIITPHPAPVTEPSRPLQSPDAAQPLARTPAASSAQGQSFAPAVSASSTTSSEAPTKLAPSASPLQPSRQKQFSLVLHNPDQYGEEQAARWVWHPVKMIASLPHVEVRFQDASGAPLDVMLMLDTGACGADIMLHSRAMRELNLGLGRGLAGSGQRNGSGSGSKSSYHFVRGVGGDNGDSVRVEVVDLPWVEISNIRFGKVKCMYAGVGGLDISLYSSGIICGDLVARLAMVIDYSRRRIGFLRAQLSELPPALSALQGQSN
mmetsp:Transcript_36269/g.80722  ORF Transcript_36269/g.80722 Transcript_36269/m.80722 type:complete len:304 (+) Transcript_36269:2-913(+)